MQDRQNGRAAEQLLLTATQVQHRLGVDRSTVYRMALDGRLAAIKVGKQWRFPAERIEALVAGVAPGSVSGPGLPVSGPGLPVTPDQATALIEITAELLGVMMVVTDMAGRPVTAVVNPCKWFAERLDNPATVAICVADWRLMADDPHLNTSFRTGPFGFDCARSFIRSGHNLVGMVLAGGVAPAGSLAEGLHVLDEPSRQRVLESLPRVAAALSRAIEQPQATRDTSVRES